MSNYYLILVWVVVFGLLSMIIQMHRTEIAQNAKVQRYKPVWAMILTLPIVFWAANRGWVGDTGMYMDTFANLPADMSNIHEFMSTVEKDKGFYFLSVVVKCFITSDVNKYFFIIAGIQSYLLFRVYRKYSTRYLISFFLFIASTDYISWMFNGIRQFTAVTITLFAFDYILEKKYIRAIIVIVIASLFHQSALIVIPFVFISQGKAWNKKTLLFIVIIIIAVVYVDRFTGVLDNMLQETQYKNVVSDWTAGEDDGTNIIRVLVYAVPTILSLIGLRFIKKENNKVINVCANMSIISFGFYLVSMFTSGIFIGRIPIYFSLYNYILLPWEIENMFEKKSARIVYVAMIIAYLAFYVYQIKFAWGLV